MINESVNQKYLKLNSADIITNNPDIFSKFLIKLLKKNGLNIDKNKANTIRGVMYSSLSNNNIIYNGSEFTIQQNSDDVDFRVKLSGSRFEFSIYGFTFIFNASKLTLEQLFSKIDTKLKFLFKNGITHRAIYRQGDLLDNDPDIKQPKKQFELLDKYCKKLDDMFMFYNISNEFEETITSKSIRVEISFSLRNFFNKIEYGLGNKVSWREDFGYSFQKDDLIKIEKLITSNINRMYGFKLSFTNISSQSIILFYKNYCENNISFDISSLKFNRPDSAFCHHTINQIFQKI